MDLCWVMLGYLLGFVCVMFGSYFDYEWLTFDLWFVYLCLFCFGDCSWVIFELGWDYVWVSVG